MDLSLDVSRIIASRAPLALRAVSRGWRAAFSTPFDEGEHRLPPSKPAKRAASHAKARALGFSTRSYGFGAHRGVAIWHPRGLVRSRVDIERGAVRLTLNVGAEAREWTKRKPKRTRWRAPAEDSDGDECMKCGFRTLAESCPECGRPVW